MKKITDERLLMRNLKNIRICYAIENLAIIGILIYQMLTTGKPSEVISYDNLPFLILMIGCFPAVILSLNVSGPIEDKEKRSVRKMAFISLLVFAAAFAFYYFSFLKHSVLIALVCGGIVGLGTFGLLIYWNKYRYSKEDDDEEDNR